MTTQELLSRGYPLVLVAIAIAGALQVVLSRFKIARLSAMFPAAAIEGMLAAIGLIIIVKQLPLAFGVDFESHEFWQILREAPRHVGNAYLPAIVTASVCITALFVLEHVGWRFLKLVPPPVWIFVLGTAFFHYIDSGLNSLAYAGITIAESSPQQMHCVSIPDSPLAGIQFPAFDDIINEPRTLSVLVYVVFALLLIDAVESLATIAAVDKLDPFRRKSDPDKTLRSMGICNLSSSMLGGLTIIPGIVKSTVNIIGGGRTLWANFFNALILIIFLFAARPLINLVPYSVLAAILVFVGWKLCAPRVWKATAAIGPEQLIVFLITLLVTVATDLLMGICAGVTAKLLIDLALIGLANRLNGILDGAAWRGVFKNPATGKAVAGDGYAVTFDGPIHCFNLFHAIRELQEVPPNAKRVSLHFSPSVTLIDHTAMETITKFIAEMKVKGIELELEGWQTLIPLSEHETAIRMAFAGRHQAVANT